MWGGGGGGVNMMQIRIHNSGSGFDTRKNVHPLNSLHLQWTYQEKSAAFLMVWYSKVGRVIGSYSIFAHADWEGGEGGQCLMGGEGRCHSLLPAATVSARLYSSYWYKAYIWYLANKA